MIFFHFQHQQDTQPLRVVASTITTVALKDTSLVALSLTDNTADMARTGIFNFFGLSRELRDQIYGELLDKNIPLHVRDRDCLKVLLKNGPSVALMLVNHQFADEYKEAVGRCSILVCADSGNDPLGDVKAPKLPPLLHSIRGLEMRLRLFCKKDHDLTMSGKDCGARQEMEAHQNWMTKIADQMHNPVTQVLVAMEDCGEQCTTKCLSHFPKLAKIRGFAKMVVKEIGGAEGGRDHVTLIYNMATQQMEPVGKLEDGKSMFEEDFGFYKEAEL